MAARKWVRSGSPVEIRTVVEFAGCSIPRTYRESWQAVPISALRNQLKSKGRSYTYGFLNEVGNEFQALRQALIVIRHQEGMADGKRWAAEYAISDQLIRLQEFSTSFDNRNFFVEPTMDDSSWTPAHELISFIFAGTYPINEDGALLDDCETFRQFWQPFVREPLDDVIRTFGLPTYLGRHKLQDIHYIIGFVDGALGISDRLQQQLSDPAFEYHATEI